MTGATDDRREPGVAGEDTDAGRAQTAID